MNPSHARLQNPARRLRLHEGRNEATRRPTPANYPRGYIEQLARTFIDPTSADPVPGRRPKALCAIPAARLGG